MDNFAVVNGKSVKLWPGGSCREYGGDGKTGGGGGDGFGGGCTCTTGFLKATGNVMIAAVDLKAVVPDRVIRLSGLNNNIG